MRNRKDVRSKVKQSQGQEIVKLMDSITDLVAGQHNCLVILERPFSQKILAAMHFADIHCVDISTGIPRIEMEIFNTLSREDKIREIAGLLSTVAGIVDCLEKLDTGFKNFFGDLLEIEKNLTGGQG